MTLKRGTLPPPEMVLERRLVAAFAPLLMELGLGGGHSNDGLETLLEQATAKARHLRTVATDESRRANRLQAAVTPVQTAADHSHDVQFRALDKDEGVVLRGDWTPVADRGIAKAFMLREIQMHGGDLTLSCLVRCGLFDVTSEARDDVEAEPPF